MGMMGSRFRAQRQYPAPLEPLSLFRSKPSSTSPHNISERHRSLNLRIGPLRTGALDPEPLLP